MLTYLNLNKKKKNKEFHDNKLARHLFKALILMEMLSLFSVI